MAAIVCGSGRLQWIRRLHSEAGAVGAGDAPHIQMARRKGKDGDGYPLRFRARMTGRATNAPIVAVLGTGRMGSGIARAIARNGMPLHLFDIRPEPAMALAAELGGVAWPTAAEAASHADICISMVPDHSAVETLYRGPKGLIAGIRSGSVAVDMSTVLPSTILSLESSIRSRGAGILDAPVSGNPRAAATGTMTAVMVGGIAADFERARPLFELLAKRVFHVGPLGSGAAMKLAHQVVIFGLNEALSEALVMAELAGIDRAVAYEILSSSAVAAPLLQIKRDAFLRPESTPVAFTLQLAEKDLRLVSEFAAGLGAPAQQVLTNLDIVLKAEADVGPEADYASVAVHLRRAVQQARRQ